MPECYVCGRDFPRTLVDIHRKLPGAYGGHYTEGNTVILHDGCHSSMHRIAKKACAGKKSEAEDLIDAAFHSQVSQARMRELVNYIVEAHVRRLEGEGVSKFRTVGVKIPTVDYAKLKAVVGLLRVPVKKGRMKKLSIADYLTKLVLDHVRRL